MRQEKRKTSPTIDERPHNFLLSLGVRLSTSIIPHEYRMCQRSIYTQQSKQSISAFAVTTRAQKGVPHFRDLGQKSLRSGFDALVPSGSPDQGGSRVRELAEVDNLHL